MTIFSDPGYLYGPGDMVYVLNRHSLLHGLVMTVRQVVYSDDGDLELRCNFFNRMVASFAPHRCNIKDTQQCNELDPNASFEFLPNELSLIGSGSSVDFAPETQVIQVWTGSKTEAASGITKLYKKQMTVVQIFDGEKGSYITEGLVDDGVIGQNFNVHENWLKLPPRYQRREIQYGDRVRVRSGMIRAARDMDRIPIRGNNPAAFCFAMEGTVECVRRGENPAIREMLVLIDGEKVPMIFYPSDVELIEDTSLRGSLFDYDSVLMEDSLSMLEPNAKT